MKKTLLLLSGILFVGALFAQQIPVKLSKAQAEKIGISVPYKQTQVSVQSMPMVRSSVVPTRAIGQTYYDLQTNGSLPSRITNWSDGTVAAAWIAAGYGATGSASRGTGYNYFNGTSWVNDPSTDRVEDQRAGWGTIAALGEGEIVVSHNGSDALLINVRPQKGTGDWIQTTLQGPTVHRASTNENSTALLWPSLATSGNTIHVIACTESDTGFLYQGIQTCLVYYKGVFNPEDNTISWSEPKIVGDMGNHVDWFNSFSGDNYVIAANGNTVAVCVAGAWTDAFLWKSTDNGATFTTTTIVDSYVPDNFNEDEDLVDTTEVTYVTDGATAIAVDANGIVHLAFGLYGVANPEIGDGYITYYPNVDGVLYWNENMSPFTGRLQSQLRPDSLINAGYSVFSCKDLDGDGNVWYLKDVNAHASDGYHRIGRTSQPSLAVDGNNVYLIYSSELDLPFYESSVTGKYYRGIFGVKSTDGGNSFADRVSWLSYGKDCFYVDWTIYDWDGNSESNVWTYESIENENENVYPSLAPNVVNGNLSMIWHNDYYPDNAQGEIADNATNVFYLTIPADQLGDYNNTDEIPQNLWIDETGIADNTLSGMKLYPNPVTNGTAAIAISSKESANATMEIFNLMGQMVYSENVALGEGNNLLKVNVNNLQSGVYMVNIKTSKGTSTQKMIVR